MKFKNFLKILTTLILALILPCFSLFFACNEEKYSSFEMSCFNTYLYVVVNGKISDKTKSEIEKVIIDLENDFSVVNEESIVYKFNNATKTEKIQVDQDFISLFNLSKEIYSLTGGRFNPAIYNLSKLWKLSSDTFDKDRLKVEIPENADIINGQKYAKEFENLSISEDKITKTTDEIKLDFGGIAKGLAVDKIVKILKEENFTKGYVSFGGSSIYSIKVDEDLKIIHPRKTENNDYIISVSPSEIENKGISTSGDYMRYYLDDNGNYYSHIIDEKTGFPINNGITSLTVIGENNAKLDALSTSLIQMEFNDVKKFVSQNLSDYKVIAVYSKDVKRIYTNIDSENFTILDKSYSL